MTKVYVITSGEYSDYHIDCIFSTREQADLYVNKFSFDEHTVEEYILDEEKGRIENPLKIYEVSMDIDGNTDRVTGGHDEDEEDIGKEYFYDYARWMDVVKDDPRLLGQKYMNLYCYANDEQHAIKIANEKRIQHIANGTWGQNN